MEFHCEVDGPSEFAEHPMPTEEAARVWAVATAKLTDCRVEVLQTRPGMGLLLLVVTPDHHGHVTVSRWNEAK
jgi:hypothetical protein